MVRKWGEMEGKAKEGGVGIVFPALGMAVKVVSVFIGFASYEALGHVPRSTAQCLSSSQDRLGIRAMSVKTVD